MYRVRLDRPSTEYYGAHIPHRIVQAYPKQWLAGVLQDVDYLLLRILQVDAFAVGEQMIVGAVAHRLGQPPSKFFLQKFDDAANPLQRNSLASQGTNDGDLGQIFD